MIVFVGWEYLLELFEEGRMAPPQIFSTTEAMIPLAVCRNFDVMATSFAALTSGMLMFGCFYFLSIYFIIVAGFSPTKSGSQLLYFSPGLGEPYVLAFFCFPILMNSIRCRRDYINQVHQAPSPGLSSLLLLAREIL